MKKITSKAFNEQIKLPMPKPGSMNHTPYSSSPSNSSCDSYRRVKRNQWDFRVENKLVPLSGDVGMVVVTMAPVNPR